MIVIFPLSVPSRVILVVLALAYVLEYKFLVPFLEVFKTADFPFETNWLKRSWSKPAKLKHSKIRGFRFGCLSFSKMPISTIIAVNSDNIILAKVFSLFLFLFILKLMQMDREWEI